MDAKDLLARALPEGKFELAGLGWIGFRSLSRAEAFRCKIFGNDLDATENYILHCALVNPPLTEEEAQIFREHTSPQEMEELIEAIMTVSRLGKGANKSS